MRASFLLTFMCFICVSAIAEEGELSLRQKILMPGPLSSAHAKYETECEQCHISFDKKNLSSQCLECHEYVAEDRETKTGFHGQHNFALISNCDTCHSEHEGREFDITSLQPEVFNHQHTRFPLDNAHQFLACDSCHKSDDKFRDADASCNGCHKEDEPHKGKLGDQCDTCHRPTVWLDLKAYDHSETQFPLEGQHKELPCKSCHFGQQYKLFGPEHKLKDDSCGSCHFASDIHNGGNGNQCDECHSTIRWNDLKFDHDKTDFPLRGGHENLSCQSCHASGEDPVETSQECGVCHASDDVHFGRNGDKCESCHTEFEWKKTTFDHNRDTDYLLTGKHQELACTTCHQGNVNDSLPRDCRGCHAADDVHKNESMTLCGTCHNTTGWRSTNLFDHDFTAFPLVGMHQIVPCESCHVGNQFDGIATGCNDCHAHEDVHKGSMGGACESCHTPNSWKLWLFDHNQQTEFTLDGKHVDLACNDCHEPHQEPSKTSPICGNCHRTHDIHKGEFGMRCDRCHSTQNFFELMFQ